MLVSSSAWRTAVRRRGHAGPRFRRVLLGTLLLSGAAVLWTLAGGSSSASAATRDPTVSITTMVTQPTKTTVRTRAAIVWRIPRSTKQRQVTVKVSADAKARAPWKTIRTVTLRWSNGAYRGTATVVSTSRPKITVWTVRAKKDHRTSVRASRAAGKLSVTKRVTRVEGAKATVKLTVQPAFDRTVRLQQSVGGTWRTMKTVQVKGARSKTVSVSVPATEVGTSSWRLVSSETKRVSKKVRGFSVSTAAPAVTTITGLPSSVAATAASPGVIRAVVTPARGRSVNLQQRSSVTGGWETVQTVVTATKATSSAVSLTLPPRQGGRTDWRLSVPRVKGLFAQATSPAIGVTTTLATGPLLGVTDVQTVLRNRVPLVIAHRGGRSRYPEASRQAYQAASSTGFAIEADLRRLSDGTLVLLHDATTNRTLVDQQGLPVTKQVSALTLAQWKALRVAPAYPGGPYGTPMTWDEFLDEFGGRAILFAEVKEAAEADEVVESVVARGLESSVILQSSAAGALTEVNRLSALWGLDLTVRRLLSASFFERNPGVDIPSLLAARQYPLLGASLANTSNWLLPFMQPFASDEIAVIPHGVTDPASVPALLEQSAVAGLSGDDPWALWAGAQ